MLNGLAGRGSLVTEGWIEHPATDLPAAPRTNGSGETNMTIRNPIEWGTAQFQAGSRSVESGSHAIYHKDESLNSLVPEIRQIKTEDLKDVLAKGLADFGAYRTDVIFLCIIYP